MGEDNDGSLRFMCVGDCDGCRSVWNPMVYAKKGITRIRNASQYREKGRDGTDRDGVYKGGCCLNELSD